jgi:hypothetical protein
MSTSMTFTPMPEYLVNVLSISDFMIAACSRPVPIQSVSVGIPGSSTRLPTML